MGEKLGLDGQASEFPPAHRFAEMGGVPANDDGGASPDADGAVRKGTGIDPLFDDSAASAAQSGRVTVSFKNASDYENPTDDEGPTTVNGFE